MKCIYLSDDDTPEGRAVLFGGIPAFDRKSVVQGKKAKGAIVDPFIAAGEKWLQRSGLVLSLPHGYDGQDRVQAAFMSVVIDAFIGAHSAKDFGRNRAPITRRINKFTRLAKNDYNYICLQLGPL